MGLVLMVEIDGKLYGKRPPAYRTCPVCGRGRKNPKDSRAEGFARAGWNKHVFACYEKALAKLGYREGVYDDEVMLHPLVLLRDASSAQQM